MYYKYLTERAFILHWGKFVPCAMPPKTKVTWAKITACRTDHHAERIRAKEE